MKSLIFILGIVLGIFISEYVVVFRASCDTTKYGWQWANLKRYSEEPFKCYKSNQAMERETNLYMIYQVIRGNIIYTLKDLI